MQQILSIPDIHKRNDEQHNGDHAPAGDCPATPVAYRVYKRRFFGLTQLVLLNIVVSWDWLTFSAVSFHSAEYFDVSETTINWLSTGFLFAFVIISPYVKYLC
ncbi:hypothetical protein LTR66_005461 [Elasticomyces elasticus]|nr:hypothetical protein LTR66_005461 [Elasticomyces elasticus]